MTSTTPAFIRPDQAPRRLASYDDDEDVMRAHKRDVSEVKHVTVAKLQKIGVREMGRGYRQGQRDLLAEAGFDTVTELLEAVADWRANQ